MTPSATLTISPTLYREHLTYPEILPTILAWSAEVITGEGVEWAIHEGQSADLVTEVDYELSYPVEDPVKDVIVWKLSGCITTALVTLRMLVLCEDLLNPFGGRG